MIRNRGKVRGRASDGDLTEDQAAKRRRLEAARLRSGLAVAAGAVVPRHRQRPPSRRPDALRRRIRGRPPARLSDLRGHALLGAASGLMDAMLATIIERFAGWFSAAR
jgi:hypothetical protein